MHLPMQLRLLFVIFVAKYLTLKEQTVFEFKSSYLKAKSKNGTEVKKLTTKARGRPKLLPEELMSKTIKTNKALRLKGAQMCKCHKCNC